jgi:hypothetical protein
MANDRARVPVYALRSDNRLLGATFAVSSAVTGSPLTTQVNYSATRFPLSNLISPRPGAVWVGVPEVVSGVAWFDLRIALAGTVGAGATNRMCIVLTNTNAVAIGSAYRVGTPTGAPSSGVLGGGPDPSSIDASWQTWAPGQAWQNTETDLRRYQSIVLRHPHLGTSIGSATHVWLRLAFPIGTSVFQIGHIWAGQMLEFKGAEASTGIRPDGEAEQHAYANPEHTSLFAQTWRTKGPHIQSVQLSWPQMTQTVFESMEGWWHGSGGGSDYVLFAQDVTALSLLEQRCIYGRLGGFDYTAGMVAAGSNRERTGRLSLDLTADATTRAYI